MTTAAENTHRSSARHAGACLALALVLVGIAPAAAQMIFAPDSLQRYFRVEWQPTQNRRGPAIEGYVHNTSYRSAQRVSLQIERVDAAGSVVGSSTLWIPGEIPMTDRVYFSASVPAAASYRVQVLSFDWTCQGGGGGGGM
jgi:hypothetical protein